MKFQVVDLQQNLIAEFEDEFSMDRWLIEQISSNKITLGKFKTHKALNGKKKVAEVENKKSELSRMQEGI